MAKLPPSVLAFVRDMVLRHHFVRVERPSATMVFNPDGTVRFVDDSDEVLYALLYD